MTARPGREVTARHPLATHLLATRGAITRDLARQQRSGSPTGAQVGHWERVTAVVASHADGVDSDLRLLLPRAAHEAHTAVATGWSGVLEAMRRLGGVLRSGTSPGAPDTVLAQVVQRLEALARDEDELVAAGAEGIVWEGFVRSQRTALAPDEEAFAVPWLLDGASEQVAAVVLATLPDHVLRTLHAVWLPAYDDLVAAVWAPGLLPGPRHDAPR